jgi:hypothetical protein
VTCTERFARGIVYPESEPAVQKWKP